MTAYQNHERKRVLITVKAYPLPSRSYDELVCTAGITDEREWIRIYPVPFRFLKDEGQYKKYQWVDINLKKAKKDFRPESYSPADTSLEEMDIIETVDTSKKWRKRMQLVLEQGPKVYTSMTELIDNSKDPKNVSLATFKPAKITGFEFEEERQWSEGLQKNLQQRDLFDERGGKGDKDIVQKLPYKFYYKLVDENGKSSRMMIEDWEIGALYWNCLKQAEGNEEIALQKVKRKVF
ncbi:hypothetical protein [Rhodohalobacter sp.]|uniref:hypothetical protein n=1 Tax=Rhodohalobacter sp. TaxID=1974210 RepID=UPI002ACE4271|nr:hypothetical protein [Rhodohalobacter sp.]MDZ7754781.1 hypothetical protein [Rhodohalobacter sp.]